MIIDKLVVGPAEENSYLLGDEKFRKGILIDPGGEGGELLRMAERRKIELLFILHTHGHADHIGGDREIKEKTGIPIYIHKEDAEMLTNPEKNLSQFFYGEIKAPKADGFISDGEIISMGDIKVEVIHSPGHTKGGVCFKASHGEENVIFTGDTLFAGSIGRTDFPGGSEERLLWSIQSRLMVFEDGVKIYPGHGPVSTIGEERKYNPFLQGLKVSME